MTEKDEELALFNEMRRREKERNDLLLLQKYDEFDSLLGMNIFYFLVFIFKRNFCVILLI